MRSEFTQKGLTIMSRKLFATGLVGIAFGTALYLSGLGVDAADPPAVRQAGIQPPAPATGTPPSAEFQSPRALLDSYCVTCHNERLKTAGLMLDKIDVGQPGAHAEVLEKVVRKLRSGQ